MSAHLQRAVTKVPQPLLTIEIPDKPTGTFPLALEYTHVGRAYENEIHLPFASVSNRHCMFIRRQEQVILRDLDSCNGTLVNGQPITEIALVPKDQIQIGGVSMVFSIGETSLVRKPNKLLLIAIIIAVLVATAFFIPRLSSFMVKIEKLMDQLQGSMQQQTASTQLQEQLSAKSAEVLAKDQQIKEQMTALEQERATALALSAKVATLQTMSVGTISPQERVNALLSGLISNFTIVTRGDQVVVTLKPKEARTKGHDAIEQELLMILAVYRYSTHEFYLGVEGSPSTPIARYTDYQQGQLPVSPFGQKLITLLLQNNIPPDRLVVIQSQVDQANTPDQLRLIFVPARNLDVPSFRLTAPSIANLRP